MTPIWNSKLLIITQKSIMVGGTLLSVLILGKTYFLLQNKFLFLLVNTQYRALKISPYLIIWLEFCIIWQHIGKMSAVLGMSDIGTIASCTELQLLQILLYNTPKTAL